MNIYIAHSTNFDYIKKLYKPIKSSKLVKKHKFFFPHDTENKLERSQKIIEKSDLVIAEVSLQSTGMGIELGWADAAKVQILCIYEKNVKYSGALKVLTDNFIEYSNEEDLIESIDNFINTK